MPCNCHKKTQEVVEVKKEDAVKEAEEIALPACYLCTKKHIERAKIFFEEYHTGYPMHIKNLVESLKVAEEGIKQCFLTKMSVLGQLDMAAGELLGNGDNKDTMSESHIEIANKIRDERIKLQDDPLYIPKFDDLLVAIQILQYTE